MNDSLDQSFEEKTPIVGNVLVVDDESGIRQSIAYILSDSGFQVTLAANGREANDCIAKSIPDVVLLDVRMPERSGLSILKDFLVQLPNSTIILMSGEATLAEALEGVQAGAFDFLEKPLTRPRLLNAVRRAIARVNLLRSRLDFEPEILIGNSPVVRELFDQVKRIAKTKARVLILGESGTGKDLVAKAIHRQSARNENPFLKINCAAIPLELIESQLFGHVKGAFTGAVSARKGLFESANGGTVFLDEVGELPLAAQAKLLRVIQNGEINPVGSDFTLKVDVRIVAATNRDLKQDVKTGKFREDLYYRLAVVEIANPPLRDRRDDIPQLVKYFNEQVAQEHGLLPLSISEGQFRLFCVYDWPGNVRELRNLVERLVIYGQEVLDRNLMSMLNYDQIPVTGLEPDEAILSWEAFKHKSEKSYLLKVLKQTRGNMAEAARLLQVERSTVHKWVKALEIDLDLI
ncbi:MAG: sigma-54 dependent transcriptional regulator [Proteobacteria bacterium]|nr:sigma-54 dependent transcriptional regulator [Pseudomonadota bacterium]